MGVNAVIGGVLGGAYGLIYANDVQDYSTFWSNVLKGIGRGLQFSPFGGAINGLGNNAIKVAINQIYAKTISKSVAIGKSAVSQLEKQNKIVYFT